MHTSPFRARSRFAIAALLLALSFAVLPRTADALPTAFSSVQDAAADAAPADDAAPEDAPAEDDVERGLHRHDPGAFDGYTLFAPLLSKVVYLIDMDGTVVHTWTTDSAPGAWVYLLDDGTLLRTGRHEDDVHFAGGGIGGRIQKLAPDGTILWNWLLSDEQRCQHHDVEPLPNGNLLLIAWERKSREEALAHGRAPEFVNDRGFWPDMVIEARPTPPEGAEIVWEWHSWDHLIQDRDEALVGYGDVTEHPERIDVNADHRDRPPLTEEERRREEELLEQMRALGYAGGTSDDGDDGAPSDSDRLGDWLHTNAIDYHAEHDLIVLSTPHLCELWVLDHSTTTAEAASGSGGRWGKGGDLLWRWGNPRTYGGGDDGDKRLFYQHDPTWVAGAGPDELRLLVYNNGGSRPEGDYSSVDELVLPFDPERGFVMRGPRFGPEEPAWSFGAPDVFFSPFISGAQRLPNGNTLICAGTDGRLIEVTGDGTIVWEYWNPYGGDVPAPDHAGNAPPKALFRATRLSRDDPRVAALLGER